MVARRIALALCGAVTLAAASAATPADAQFFFGGRSYCFYDDGWHGPGYYWCGYAFRRGIGYGGPVGWHGWHRGGGGRGFGGGGRGFGGGRMGGGGHMGGGGGHGGGHMGGGGGHMGGGGGHGGGGHGGGGHGGHR